MTLKFVIPGQAVSKQRPRSRTIIREKDGNLEKKTWHYTPERTREFTEKARIIAQNACQTQGFEMIPYPNPVSVTLTFFVARKPTARPDIGGLCNALLDVLSGIAYEDDSQVVKLVSRKIKADEPATWVEVL